MLLASSGWKPGILLDTLQSTEQHSQQKLIQSKMSTVPWLRNFGTDSFFFFFNQSETWLWVWLGNLLFLPMSPGVLWSPTLIFLSPAWFLSPEITMSCMPLSWNGHLGCFFFFLTQPLAFMSSNVSPIHTSALSWARTRQRHSRAQSPWSLLMLGGLTRKLWWSRQGSTGISIDQWSSLRAGFASREYWAMSGDIFVCCDSGSATGIRLRRGQGCYHIPYNTIIIAGQSPPQRMI